MTAVIAFAGAAGARQLVASSSGSGTSTGAGLGRGTRTPSLPARGTGGAARSPAAPDASPAAGHLLSITARAGQQRPPVGHMAILLGRTAACVPAPTESSGVVAEIEIAADLEHDLSIDRPLVERERR